MELSAPELARIYQIVSNVLPQLSSVLSPAADIQLNLSHGELHEPFAWHFIHARWAHQHSGLVLHMHVYHNNSAWPSCSLCWYPCLMCIDWLP